MFVSLHPYSVVLEEAGAPVGVVTGVAAHRVLRVDVAVRRCRLNTSG